jgi:zinc D-Ala-D-Ala carboxypeptidase
VNYIFQHGSGAPELTLADFAGAIRMRKDIMLTSHFSLKEVITTSHSEIDNWPTEPETIQKLQYCCVNILEKVRAHFGRPVRVNSGFRCPALNTTIGGSTTSQHMKGEAIDMEIDGVANGDICKWIEGNLTFDQLILEFYTQGQPNSGWVHCSVIPTGNRREALTAARQNGRTVYLPGLQF